MHVHKFSSQLTVLGYEENGYSIKKKKKRQKNIARTRNIAVGGMA